MDYNKAIKFPPYQYREYPKWVEGRIVNSEAEELLLLEDLTEAAKSDGRQPDRKRSDRSRP
jgi:hypothetical protein